MIAIIFNISFPRYFKILVGMVMDIEAVLDVAILE